MFDIHTGKIGIENIEQINTPEGDFLLSVRTGKGMAMTKRSALQFADYSKAVSVPKKYNAYKNRKPLPIQDWGNNEWGNCTIASQGILSQNMERQEQRKTIQITAEETTRVYMEMVKRLYGNGEFWDMGAYEVDALNNWRRPDLTFRDTKGNPYTISAYTKINHTSVEEVKKALFLSGAKGIKVCFSLPYAWAYRPDMVWDIPDGQPLTGIWQPYSWGGHSMTALANWDENWLYGLPHSWNLPDGRISWKAFAIYCDEAHLVIDDVNYWKKDKTKMEGFKLDKLIHDVNAVSDMKIK